MLTDSYGVKAFLPNLFWILLCFHASRNFHPGYMFNNVCYFFSFFYKIFILVLLLFLFKVSIDLCHPFLFGKPLLTRRLSKILVEVQNSCVLSRKIITSSLNSQLISPLYLKCAFGNKKYHVITIWEKWGLLDITLSLHVSHQLFLVPCVTNVKTEIHRKKWPWFSEGSFIKGVHLRQIKQLCSHRRMTVPKDRLPLKISI